MYSTDSLNSIHGYIPKKFLFAISWPPLFQRQTQACKTHTYSLLLFLNQWLHSYSYRANLILSAAKATSQNTAQNTQTPKTHNPLFLANNNQSKDRGQ